MDWDLRPWWELTRTTLSEDDDPPPCEICGRPSVETVKFRSGRIKYYCERCI